MAGVAFDCTCRYFRDSAFRCNGGIFEKENGMERGYDLASRLLKDRIIILGEEVNDVTNLAVKRVFGSL